MNTEFDNIELFDAYIDQILSQEELIIFERRLETEEGFAAQFAMHQDMIKSIQLDEELKWKNLISKAGEAYEQKKISKVVVLQTEKEVNTIGEAKIMGIRLQRMLAVAASIALLVTAGLFLWRNSTGIGEAEMLAQYAKVDIEQTTALVDDLRSYGMIATDKEERDALALALEAYEKNNFQQAEEALNQITISDSNESIAKYYLGLTKLQLKEYEEATSIFESLERNVDFQEKIASKWYAAIAYHLSGNKKKAKEILTQVSESEDNNYSQKAIDLLNILN